MKKKLVMYMLAILMFSLSIVTILFVIVVKYENMEKTKHILSFNSDVIVNIINNSNENEIKDIFLRLNNNRIKFTYLNKDGKVVFSTNNIDEVNIILKPEVAEAIEKGEGNSVRFNSAYKLNYIYHANKLKNGNVLISSIELEAVLGTNKTYLKYYIIVAMFVVIMALMFSSQLAYAIVKPIKKLEFITSRIARGELDRRVSINSRDEIGQLAVTFNNMADKLQSTLNDALHNQNRLQAILKSMDSGVVAIDQDNKIIMINPCAKSIFEIKEDIIGKSIEDIYGYIELKSIFSDYDGEYNEIRLSCSKEKYLRVKITDIISGYDKIGKVAVIQDVTNMKKLENVRTQFVANVSHELKTPLTSIKGFAETLRDVDDKKTKERFLNIINEEAERLSRLINDILILSHIESENDEDKSECIDVVSMINDICCLVDKSAKNKDIKVSLISKSSPIIKVNKDRFKQMVINLIDNAIKYSDNNSEVTVGVETVNNDCVIWVKDKGIGIPKEDIGRIFERFYRVDKARSRAQGGTGLGLAIVKHIVLNFNGSIEVESELEKGSKFTVKIPM